MTTITKQDRIAAVAAILKATFAPQQDDLINRIQDRFKQLCHEKWPRFYELRQDPQSREFVPPSQGSGLEYEEGSYLENFTQVTDWLMFTFPTKRGACGQSYVYLNKVEIPRYSRMIILKQDDPLVAEYIDLTKKMTEARRETLDVFAAYSNRERMEADLPALARYLPARPTNKPTAIALVTEDVMTNLAKLGIPPDSPSVKAAPTKKRARAAKAA